MNNRQMRPNSRMQGPNYFDCRMRLMHPMQAGLLRHLTALKDYFLLAKGEFAHAFLVEAKRCGRQLTVLHMGHSSFTSQIFM